MDPVTIGIGIAAILYGAYTLYLRSQDPSKLGKLEAMKNRFGDVAGSAIHLVAYSIVPIAFGVIVALAGTRGDSLY